MIKENIYVAINKKDEIQWVKGSSRKTRYFKTDRYLKGAVEYHNKYYPDDIWEIRKCIILEDEPQMSYTPDCPFCKRYGTEDCLGSDCKHYKTYKDESQIMYYPQVDGITPSII